ncbi:hypothetical protein CTheo_8617 [Ceratobasidium theobromae]|uniref:Uncharacterized protein n=1 Tax=Ceratobasidium theobromae TaxID=1582974 RepID=A0A5N5Q835_9AGAM|nr:hypothetical protein CTheo_8617 [Ceratobasidium theobromae]
MAPPKKQTSSRASMRKSKGTIHRASSRLPFVTHPDIPELWDGLRSQEEGFHFRDEDENRARSRELHDKVLLRAMNGWAFVNEAGNFISPNQCDLTGSGAYLLGWTATLSGGSRRVQRIMTGYWPPRENLVSPGPGQVWRMHTAVLMVPVAEIFHEQVHNRVMDFTGVWVLSSNNTAQYLLQNPLTAYHKRWNTVRALIGLQRYGWEDINPDSPRPSWMNKWVSHMFRMEEGYPVGNPEDPASESDDEKSLLGESDAESIPADDTLNFPSGTGWHGGDPWGAVPTWHPENIGPSAPSGAVQLE